MSLQPQSDPQAAAGADAGAGHEVLSLICDWRTARAELQSAAALYDKKTAFGSLLEDDNTPSGADERAEMNDHADLLATVEPATVREARELLRVALEILAWRQIDPDHPLAEGPLLELVRNVLNSLDYANGDLSCDPSKDRFAIKAL